jgi:hypothetical protein
VLLFDCIRCTQAYLLLHKSNARLLVCSISCHCTHIKPAVVLAALRLHALALYSYTVYCAAVLSALQDLEMYDPTQDTPALARTSNMNADLGQVSYVCIHYTLLHIYTVHTYFMFMYAASH